MTDHPPVTLRPATAADEALLLVWANDVGTRAAGFRPDPISAEDHRRWLADRLGSASGRLLVGMAGDVPVGQIRLDRDAGGRVEIGIAVAPEARGRGVGHELLRAALDEARRDDDLRPSGFLARIRPDNAASIALFTGAGFRHTGDVTIGTWRCLLYEADD
jgi:RimJ/RimL family protein N-acetyltransferase